MLENDNHNKFEDSGYAESNIENQVDDTCAETNISEQSSAYGSDITHAAILSVTQQEPASKKRKPGRVGFAVALVVSCAIVSLVSSFGGTYIAHKFFLVSDITTPSDNNTGDTDDKGDGDTEDTDDTPSLGDTEPLHGLKIPEIVVLTADSIVEVYTETVVNGGRFGQYIVEGAGSGVIISADGYIVTNNHVIDGTEKITVRLKNGTEYEATLIGRDSKTDIAVLKINEKDLKPVVFGDSDELVVGELAVAIGNPLGMLGGTVTDGIISALSRNIDIDGQMMNLLQMSAAVNPGNSGGGLFNRYGELVGIVNAKASGYDIEGLGFAIPINIVKSVIDDLIKYSYVPR